MSVIHITKDNFQTEVMDSKVPVLLDFWASWCGPCRMVSPVVDEIADETPTIKVGKINVDEQRELAAAFNIMSIPTLVVIKNGKITNQALGARRVEAADVIAGAVAAFPRRPFDLARQIGAVVGDQEGALVMENAFLA